MDAEILERLLLDRALGVLSPDVAALLTAYLASDAGAAARAREYERATTVARHALQAGTGATLPPFPAARLRQLETAHRRLVFVRNISGLAAAILIGVGLGSVFFGAARHDGGPSPAAPRVVNSAVNPPSLATSTAGGFWSAARVYEQARSGRAAPARKLIWDSAVSAPRLGGEL